MSRTWFITGAARGLGRAFTTTALDRGDNVVATARDTGELVALAHHGHRLLPLTLDVTDPTSVARAVHDGHEHFGVLDIVVNNAGAGDRGTFEELSEQAVRGAMEVNFFGVAAVTRAALPIMRAQRAGHIVQISSLGGLIAMPMASAYVASKWALEGLSEALAAEVSGFGINVTIVEPGAYATDQGRSPHGQANVLTDYEALRSALREHATTRRPGDPMDAARALLRLVDDPTPPLRAVLGAGGVDALEQIYRQRIESWRRAERLLS